MNSAVYMYITCRRLRQGSIVQEASRSVGQTIAFCRLSIRNPGRLLRTRIARLVDPISGPILRPLVVFIKNRNQR